MTGEYPIAINEPCPTLTLKVGRKAKRDHFQHSMGVLPNMRIINPNTNTPDIVPFICDTKNLENKAAASIHRFGRHMPDQSVDEILKELQVTEPSLTGKKLTYKANALHKESEDLKKDIDRFGKALIKLEFTPLTAEDVYTPQEHLQSSSYGESRKDQIVQAVVGNTLHLTHDDSINFEAQIKNEGTTKPKHPRGINAPPDHIKGIIASVCKSVDKATFRERMFTKGMDPSELPAHMMEIFRRERVLETDFTSFEAHHRGIFSGLVHFWFMYMIADCGISKKDKEVISRLILGTNNGRFKDLSYSIAQRLMSGLPWTSSSNGVLNYIIMSYIITKPLHRGLCPEELAVKAKETFVGLVEGDDGICGITGSVLGADEHVNEAESIAKKIGVIIKFVPGMHFGDVSFCGKVCDPDTLTVVTDPIKVLRGFCVVPIRYDSCSRNIHLGVLRAKAMSYLYLYPSCPIVSVMCEWVLERTRAIDCRARIDEMQAYEKEVHLRAYAAHVATRDLLPVSDKNHRATDVSVHSKDYRSSVRNTTRFLVADKFNVSIDEQLRIEGAIRNSLGDKIVVDLTAYLGPHDVHHVQNHLQPGGYPMMPIPQRDHIPAIIEQVLRDGGLESSGKNPAALASDARFKRLATGFSGDIDPSYASLLPEGAPPRLRDGFSTKVHY